MGSAVGVALAGSPLRQLLSLRRASQRLKVSLETALRLQTCVHSVTAHFHQPGGADKRTTYMKFMGSESMVMVKPWRAGICAACRIFSSTGFNCGSRLYLITT